MPLSLLLLLAACGSMAQRPQPPSSPWWEAPQAAAADSDATTAGADDASPSGTAPSGAVLLARSQGDSVVVVPDSAASGQRRTARQRPATLERPTPEGLAGSGPGDSPGLDSPGLDSLGLDSLTATPPAVLRARRAAWAQRDKDDRQRVRQVNEYALWCVEQGLWDEARIHLEQALARDSLAASLHNNLAIVYERQGRRREARQHYTLATELNPDRDLYQTNLRRLRRALQHRPPSADSLATDEALVPPPRGAYRPHDAQGTDRAEGKPQP